MKKLFSRSVTTSLLLMITLACATTQAKAAALEGPRPVVTVQVYSSLGFTTFKATRLETYSFTASWEIPSGGPTGTADLYFGMLGPDSKSAYTWMGQNGSYMLVKGMRPALEGISLRTPATYSSFELAGKDLRYTVTGSEQPGMYLVFALVVGVGKSPTDPSNWIQIEMRPLFVQ